MPITARELRAHFGRARKPAPKPADRIHFASAGAVPPRSAFRCAQDLAAKFGASPFLGDHTSPVFQCWVDRVAWLPSAAERGSEALAAAVAEANRYA